MRNAIIRFTTCTDLLSAKEIEYCCKVCSGELNSLILKRKWNSKH